MKRRRRLVPIAAGALLALWPAAGQTRYFNPNQPEVAGRLDSDDSCPQATHVLVWPCFGGERLAYVYSGNGGRLDRFVGRFIQVRFQEEPSDCDLPLLRVRRILQTPGPACPSE